MPAAGNPERPAKRSRITAACAICRAKRQKCSGEKPSCDQCRAHGEECWWSDQKKRGPAKDYLRSLQDRLQETERLLLGVLGQVSDRELLDALQANASEAAPSPSHQTWTSTLSGQNYWAQYPLSGLDSVRDWQNQRASAASNPPSQRLSESRLPPASQRKPAAARMQINPALRNNHSPVGVVPESNGADTQPESFFQHNIGAQYNGNHEWQQTPPQPPVRTERRYSDETQDVAKTLFSISHHHGESGMQQQQQPPAQDWEVQGHGENDELSPKLDTLPAQFPKQLFWG